MALKHTACVLVILTSGCPLSVPPACGEFEEVFVWADADGDGFGDPSRPGGYVCVPGDCEATNNVDCDDAAPDTHPGAEEVCDLTDDNCDTHVDEGLPQDLWFRDKDGDGFGSNTEIQLFCTDPGSDWLLDDGDCDDLDPSVHPLALEVCNSGIDDDCDGAADDGDGSVDATTTTTFYVDVDGDGFGGDTWTFQGCEAPNQAAVTLSGDCDDLDDRISPAAIEVCSPPQQPLDEDCDGLVDDADPSLDPATQNVYHADADADGYGDPYVQAFACVPTVGLAVDNADDCDDTDPGANVEQGWFADEDGDGVGAGLRVVTQCLRPAGMVAPEAAGVDCAPDDPAISPLAFDPCDDGIDQDCSGSDVCQSCQAWLDARGAGAASGVYAIEPTPGQVVDVYCDQDTDGGGWTLVSSTQTAPPADEVGAWHRDLTTLDPANAHADVWGGMRPATAGTSDLRFACKAYAGVALFDVDLSFYDVHWYDEITTGTDADSCFNEMEGAGADPPPERRNNLSGVLLPAGDSWAAGYLEGEDTCGDATDFTVDFDDRGMDSNMSDGTDWGEDDNVYKCGTSAVGQQWFLFVRE